MEALLLFLVIVIWIVGIVFLLVDSDDNFLTSLYIFIISFACFILGGIFSDHMSSKNTTKYDNKIIQQYQQGDYSLEIKIDGDKVDTLYIFK